VRVCVCVYVYSVLTHACAAKDVTPAALQRRYLELHFALTSVMQDESGIDVLQHKQTEFSPYSSGRAAVVESKSGFRSVSQSASLNLRLTTYVSPCL
jgi:hypothetical protein